jgi:pimeloyl-ACP methyl ester carboxylesterase
MTEIDGLDIHFIHVCSPHDDPLPLIITHGWPGSIVEMLNVIGPLTDPTEYGGSAEDAFHVVIPSMPGYGFSANELYQAPRAWVEQADRNLIYFNQVDEGNHFAGWQEPGIFTTEVRAAFGSPR